MDKTTIQIDKETREMLGKLKISKRESYDEIIRRKLSNKKLSEKDMDVSDKVTKSQLGEKLKKEYGI